MARNLAGLGNIFHAIRQTACMSSRRRFLEVSAATAAVGITGCTGTPENSSTATDGESESSGEGQDTTAEEDTADVIQHDLNEPFTVGTGDDTIEYVTRNIYTADAVGSSALNEEANGVFAVPVMEITNRASEPILISGDQIVVQREDGARYEASSTATTYLSNDDRFDAEPILLEELQPDVTVTGGLVFELATGHRYGLWFNPTGILSGDEWTHYISIGAI